MSAPSLRALIASLGVLVATLALGREARAATCGNGTCEAGETAGTCAADCLCHNTATTDYGLCCCCANDPNPQGSCTPKAICSYPEIGGCCCAQFDPMDPFTCLFCVDNDPINDWCSGGIGAYESKNGTCGPGVSATCDDTEIWDDVTAGVNVRTRCATTSIPLGRVEGGAEGFSLEVSIVYNEGRPPPSELADGFSNKSTGPFGKGGWITVDRIFTDEGIYWKSSDDSGKVTGMGTRKGTRGDRNNNGYIGYTLHTPFGDRTYDYPVVLNIKGEKAPVGVYRAEPFDGYFLRVQDPTGAVTDNLGRKYTLFQHPNGPYEVYEWPLSSPGGASPFNAADPVRSASLLSHVEARFAPPDSGWLNGQNIDIIRGGFTHQNAPSFVFGPAFSSWNLSFKVDNSPVDGGMILRVVRIPGNLSSAITMTQKAGYRPEIFTTPGRQSDDLITFAWDDWRIKSIDLQVRDKMEKTLAETKSAFARDAKNLAVVSVTESETFLGIPEGDEITGFEACDVTGKAFSGTTLSLPRQIQIMYEYGDATLQHRLVAMTHATGTRTQYAYNDDQTEPRGELTDAVNVPLKTDPAMLATGFGTHVDWLWVTQVALDSKLFPADTFLGPPASQGVPLPKQLVRRPDGLVLRAMSDYDPAVFAPKTITDERGLASALTYYADTGQTKTDTRQGVRAEYTRSIEKVSVPDGSGNGTSTVYTLLSIDTSLVGANGATALLGKMSTETQNGRFFRQISYGQQLDPSDPTSGKVLGRTVEKRMLRDKYGVPLTMQTIMDGQLVAETTVGWDPRLMGPASAKTKVNGVAVASAAPMNGAGNDGLGGVVGTWQISGPGEQLQMFEQLDPLGNLQARSANGVGSKLGYAAGPDGSTLKTSVSRLTPTGEVPGIDELDTAGETDPVCK
ncbi:MAG: hypothetical protein ABJE95_03430 [Byssovorax sp.]